MAAAAEAVERQAAAAVVGRYGPIERVALAVEDARAPGEYELEPLYGHVEPGQHMGTMGRQAEVTLRQVLLGD